jgi:deazaflavin-dependent oxidoreductase (nitroreductase family)
MTNVDINDTNRDVIEQFRANKGKVTSGRFAGSDLLLLTTAGARSGQTRVNPLTYLRDGDRYVIFASRNGGPKSPDWYYNLVAHPDVTVEVGTDKFPAKAIVTSGAERERVWKQSEQQRPFLADHKARAAPREIPVIALERQKSS